MTNKFVELLTQVKELADELEQYEDVQLKLDMLEGETDYISWLEWLYNRSQQEKALEDGIKQRIDALNARKKSCFSRQERFEGMIKSILVSTGENKISLPEFTVSKRAGSWSVEIVNQEIIPVEFIKVVESVDKVSLKKALQEGIVEGACLKQGEETITIRSK